MDVAGVCQLQGLSFVRFDTGIEVADGAPKLRCKAWPMAGGIGTVPTAEVMITNISTMFLSVLVGLLVMVLQSILVGIPPLDFKLVNFTGPVIASGVMDDVDQQNN